MRRCRRSCKKTSAGAGDAGKKEHARMAEKPNQLCARPAPRVVALPGSAQGPRAPGRRGPARPGRTGQRRFRSPVGNSLGGASRSHAALMERLIADWLPARPPPPARVFLFGDRPDPAKRPRRSADVVGGPQTCGEKPAAAAARAEEAGRPPARGPRRRLPTPARAPRSPRAGTAQARSAGSKGSADPEAAPNGCSGRPSGRPCRDKESGGAGWRGCAKRGASERARNPRAWPERAAGTARAGGAERRAPRPGLPRCTRRDLRPAAPQPRRGGRSAPLPAPGAAVRAASWPGSAPPPAPPTSRRLGGRGA